MSQNPFVTPSPQEPQAPVSSAAARAALICGLLVIIPFIGLAAIILGIIGLVKISNSRGTLKGNGMSIAGLILGVVMMVAWCGVGSVGLAFYGVRAGAEVACNEQLATIGAGIEGYMNAGDGQAPPDLQALLDGNHVSDEEKFICLADGFRRIVEIARQGQSGQAPPTMDDIVDPTDVDGTGSYAYGHLLDITALADPATVPLVWDKEPWHAKKTVHVLWADFRISSIDVNELARALEENAELYNEPRISSEEAP